MAGECNIDLETVRIQPQQLVEKIVHTSGKITKQEAVTHRNVQVGQIHFVYHHMSVFFFVFYEQWLLVPFNICRLNVLIPAVMISMFKIFLDSSRTIKLWRCPCFHMSLCVFVPFLDLRLGKPFYRCLYTFLRLWLALIWRRKFFKFLFCFQLTVDTLIGLRSALVPKRAVEELRLGPEAALILYHNLEEKHATILGNHLSLVNATRSSVQVRTVPCFIKHIKLFS